MAALENVFGEIVAVVVGQDGKVYNSSQPGFEKAIRDDVNRQSEAAAKKEEAALLERVSSLTAAKLRQTRL